MRRLLVAVTLVAALVLAGSGWVLGWGVITWWAAVVGALLAGAVIVAGQTDDRRGLVWLAAMLLATGLQVLPHLHLRVYRQPAVAGAMMAALVGLGWVIRPACEGVGRRLRELLPGWRLPLAAGLWLLATGRWFTLAEWRATPQPVVWGLLPLATWPLGGLALVAAARQLPGAWLATGAQRLATLADSPRLPWLLGGLATVLAAGVGWFGLGPLPHVEDGIAYLYQAKTWLAGGLSQPAPPVPGAFDARFCWVFLDDGGRSYGIFPPGWPLLLAAGVAAGAPWLINPLLAGASTVVAVKLVAADRDRRLAAAAGLLLATSPFFVLQGASFLAHPALLWWVLVAVAGAVVVVERRSTAGAAAAGLGVGLAVATRYGEGALLGLVLAGWLAAQRAPARLWLVGLVALAPGLGLVLADNAHKTGSPLTTPVERWFEVNYGEAINRPGFGPGVGLEWDHSLGPGHTPREGLWNLNLNLVELNRTALGWPGGSLALALIGLLTVPATARERLWLVFSGSLLLLYWAYWYHCVALGPRVLHPLLIPLASLTVHGARRAGGRAAAVVGLGLCCAWLTWLPLELLTTYHNYRGRDAGDRRIVAAARELANGPAIALLAQEVAGPGRLGPDYGVGFSLNPPGFRGDVLVGRTLDQDGTPQVAAVRRAYPDRVVLLWYKERGENRLVRLADEPGRDAGEQ